MDQRRGSIFPNLKSISFRYKTLLKSLYWNTPNLEYFVTIQGSTKVVFVSRYKFKKKKNALQYNCEGFESPNSSKIL